ncbi:MAG: GNAT family N-acetyltransferase [Acidobacteria bacterium]|nr:GNAT family N-acetyltransferase [Acidobacteriota bacterium]
MIILETNNLLLRSLASEDLESVVKLNSDPEVVKYITGGEPMPREQTLARFNFYLEHQEKHQFAIWAVINKEDSLFIGLCGLQFLENTENVEVGYRLARAFWGKGLATEAAKACINYGFNKLSLPEIVAVIDPENIASHKVIEKVGLKYEKMAYFYAKDLSYYKITKAMFLDSLKEKQ